MELINELRIRRSLQSTGDLHEGVGISMENSLESELHDMSIKPDQDGVKIGGL